MNTITSALVTGASSGIGAVFARKLAARGHRVILVARRRERLEQLAAEIGGEVLAADLTDEAGLHSVEQRIQAVEDLDVVVNNAGFGTRGRFFEAPLAEQDRMHRLHVMATLRLTWAALQGMVQRNRGAIINVSSVAAFGRSPGNVSYCSTKAWINAFTAGVDLDLRSVGSAVKMQALCPGFTYSEFHDVMQLDRGKIPRALWLEPDYVVEESLRALSGNKVIVIPSLRYKAIASLLRMIPGPMLRAGVLRHAKWKADGL